MPPPFSLKKERVVNKIREMGYRFIAPHDKVDSWRKKGDTKLIMVPRRDTVTEQWVRQTFHQAGLTKEEIEIFIAEAKI